jgi:hypothetical protein
MALPLCCSRFNTVEGTGRPHVFQAGNDDSQRKTALLDQAACDGTGVIPLVTFLTIHHLLVTVTLPVIVNDHIIS